MVSRINLWHFNQALFLRLRVIFLNTINLEIRFYFDFFSLFFIARVSAISIRVYLFSFSYINNEIYFLRFILILSFFVLSIFILIFSSNLIFLIIGWDGLGLVSYLLVIFFFSRKSRNAGIITVITNRIGDVLLLLRISFVLIIGSWHVWNFSNDKRFLFRSILRFLLILARITKRAQVPFSAWLPAAIAAPTPVSALVHSSTLVTAGVYLIFRLLPLIRIGFKINFLFLIGLFTLILAGIRALFELDIKKIVALSTLSQLGLIFCSLGANLWEGTYFHLVIHAYFKAMLFIRVGNIIHLSDDFQDLRKINFSSELLRFTIFFIIISNFSLIGLPFIAGFYSKDFILENILIRTILKRNIYNWFFFGCILTSMYSIRFIVLRSMTWKNHKSLVITQDRDIVVLTSMLLLMILRVIGGSMVSWIIFNNSIQIILIKEIKFSLIIIFPLGSLIGLLWCKEKMIYKTYTEWSLGRIWSLPIITKNFFLLYSQNIYFSIGQLLEYKCNKRVLWHYWNLVEIKLNKTAGLNENYFIHNLVCLRLGRLALIVLCII